MLKCGIGHPGHEVLRRVVRPAVPPFARGHQRFEGAAKHLGVDRRFAPLALLLAGGEPISRQHVVEERAYFIVTESHRAIARFHGGAGKEPPVEEGHASEHARGSGTSRDGRVQCAEEEGFEKPTMRVTALDERGVEVPDEKVGVTIQPTARLQEGEKEESRRGEQGQFTTRFRWRTAECSFAQRENRAFEGTIESMRQGVAPHDFAPACMGESILPSRCSLERQERFDIALKDPGRVEKQCRYTHPRAVGVPCGDGALAPTWTRDHEEPKLMRRLRGQSLGNFGDEGAKGLARWGRHEKRSTCAVAQHEERRRTGPRNPEGVRQRLVQREGACGEAQVTGQRRQRCAGGEVGKKVGGSASCEHTRTLPGLSPVTVTRSMQRQPI